MMSDPEHLSDADDIRAAFDALVADPAADLGKPPPPMCECKCTGGVSPHSDRLCRARATTLILLHRWGWCDVDPAAADPPLVDPSICDENGNLTSYMCDRCADWAEQLSKQNVRTMLADPERFGAHPTCPTCHKHTQTWTDLMERRRL